MTKEEFKAWRKLLGLTQAEAAEALGISPRWLFILEKGEEAQTGKQAVISKTLALACEALEKRHLEKIAVTSKKHIDTLK